MKAAIMIAMLVASSGLADVAPITPVVTAPLPIAATPADLSVLVAAMTPDQIAAVVSEIAGNADELSLFVAALTPAQLMRLVASLQGSPALLSALMGTMSVNQAAGVVAGLAGNASALRVVMAALDTSKLGKIETRLFLADPASWAEVNDLIGQPLPARPFGNWLTSARAALRHRIDTEGYTPALLDQARQLMRKARAK